MSPLRLPRPRDRQRGNSLLLALIVLSALATLGSLTVVSVQSSLKTSTNDRAQAIAMYAAESGAAIVVDFLRASFSTTNGWSAYVSPSNNTPFVLTTAQIASVGVRPPPPPPPGPPPPPSANPFSSDQNAWYEAMLLNNRDDRGFADASDSDKDGRIIIRATGHGPQGSLAIIEWEVQRVGFPPAAVPGDPPPATPPPPPWTSYPVPITPGMVLISWHVVSL